MARVRIELISPKTLHLQGNREQTGGQDGPSCTEDHPQDRAPHLPAAGVAPHPRVERVVPSFVFAARAVEEPEWHDALALQEAVFVPPFQLRQRGVSSRQEGVKEGEGRKGEYKDPDPHSSVLRSDVSSMKIPPPPPSWTPSGKDADTPAQEPWTSSSESIQDRGPAAEHPFSLLRIPLFQKKQNPGIRPKVPKDSARPHACIFASLLTALVDKKKISPRTGEMGMPLFNALEGCKDSREMVRPEAREGGELTCPAAARRGAAPQGAEQQEGHGRSRRRPHGAPVKRLAGDAHLLGRRQPAPAPSPRAPRPALASAAPPSPGRCCSGPGAAASAAALPQCCIVLRGRFRWRGERASAALGGWL